MPTMRDMVLWAAGVALLAFAAWRGWAIPSLLVVGVAFVVAGNIIETEFFRRVATRATCIALCGPAYIVGITSIFAAGWATCFWLVMMLVRVIGY